jgi:hypothetical protein
MIQTLSEHDFRQAWKNSGRENSFSYEALGLLFEMLEELSPDWELDIIALDCEYAESTLEEIISDYGYALADNEEEEPTLDEVLEYLQENTLVCGTTPQGTIVYAQF